MIKYIKKLFIFAFFSFILYVFLTNSNLIIDSVNYSINVFVVNVLPSLLPFFILADVLINYGYVYFLNTIFKFKYSYLIFLSLFSGLPSNAKYIKSALDRCEISNTDASVMLSVTFFPNPMFVIGTIGIMLSNNDISFIILISVYLSNFIVYLLNYRKLDKVKLNVVSEKVSFSKLMRSSILNNVQNLIVILGTIVVFTTLSNVIFNYLSVPDFCEAFITGIFEMTSGIKKMSVLNISTHLKFLFISLLLSFSGISVLCQAFSILSDTKINYRLVFKNKALIVILNFLINYLYIIVTSAT